MPIDPRRPVIVGVGQHVQRTDTGEPILEPAAILAAAGAKAVDDAGVAVAAVGAVRVVRSLSSMAYGNVPRLVASMLGLRADEYVVALGGGEASGAAVATACREVADGRHEVVLVVGGEAWFSFTGARRAGRDLERSAEAPDTPPAPTEGALLDFVHPAEKALGLSLPIQQYPLFEQALRSHQGRTLAEHQRHLGLLLERLSSAAQANPYAWDRSAHTAEEIATPSSANRWVGFPYTKLMVSNEQVDMGAAVVVASAGWARRHRVDPQRWVFPLASASGEATTISERRSLHDSVLVRCVGHALEEAAGRRCADAAHVDLYSCFPSALQVQAHELGLGVDRQLSLTGGMRFSGGPWCAYALHGLAAAVDALRADPGTLGLVTSNGGALSKLVVTMLSTEPTPAYRAVCPQAAIDAAPRRAVAEGPVADGVIEAATVEHGRDGLAVRAILTALTPDGRRALGVVAERADAQAMTTEDVVGRTVAISEGGEATIS